MRGRSLSTVSAINYEKDVSIGVLYVLGRQLNPDNAHL